MSLKNRVSVFSPQIFPLFGKFSQIHELLQPYGYGQDSLDGALFDVGASSMQFDDNTRGFSLSADGPLDMRMDKGRYLLFVIIYFCLKLLLSKFTPRD